MADALPKPSAGAPRKSYKLKRQPPTPNEVVPDEILAGPLGKEAELAVAIMSRAMHVASLAQLVMEEKKDKASIGLTGPSIEEDFVRTTFDGSKTTLVHVSLMVMMAKMLQEAFPDDLILAEEDVEILNNDPEFACTVSDFLSEYGVIEEATPEKTVGWYGRCGGALYAKETPTRYWAVKPVDTTEEFRAMKQFCMTIVLIEEGQPKVAAMGCPVMAYDHVSRSTPSPRGCPIFFAVTGQGSYTQHVIMEREEGVYKGLSFMRGWPLKLDCQEKIKRGHDGLYDFLGSEQLHIAMGKGYREDIFRDAERIGSNLGSQYPKYEMTPSAIKYAWLARGEADVCWELTNGLFDESTGSEHLVDHAAGCLIATEAGAELADLDGKPLEWVGPILYKNRGLLATDPGTVPMKGLLGAINSATTVSNDLYIKRCERRKEIALTLSAVFKTMGELAETDEEKEGARRVMEKGGLLLENDEEMDEITQNSINRQKPMFGEGPSDDTPFLRGSDDGAVPMSPISS